MREINGYVGVLRDGELTWLQGPDHLFSYKLDRYATMDDALMSDIPVARIEMMIAESEDDVSKLEGPFIAASNAGDHWDFYGPRLRLSKDKLAPGHDAWSYLQDNGVTSFDSLEEVQRVREEIIRQCQCTTYICSFVFEEL